MPGKRVPFLTRVQLRNYRSIAACDVPLGPLTFLVGPNGSGKSNFMDALRLITDALRTTLDHALRDRGGVHEVRRRSSAHPTHFGIRIEFQLPDGSSGHFSFEVGARSHGDYAVQKEECVVGH
ncbi:MAG TPA: AAA family ATPase, partial [Archangium sp.]